MKAYEQQVTIVLNQAQATSLRAALSEYLRYSQEALRTNSNYCKADEHPHPQSCMGHAAALIEDLNKISLGNKSAKLASYEMVKVK